MTQGKLDWIKEELESLKEQGLYKTQKVLETGNGAEIVVEGKKLLNFCSNNYLGLATDPELKKAAKEAIDKYGVGAGAVRMIAGTTVLHVLLEEKLTEFKKTEGAIFFQSGFVTNSAVIPVMVGEGDVIFSDELNHASIIDGCRLSKAEVVRYKHNDMADLEVQIKNASFKKGLLVSDGVFSMDGDIADLPNLVALSEKYNLILMIDDSHGEGVLGEYGRGIAEHFNLHGKVDIEMGTLSKAFGVIGGFVAGKKEVVEYLRQKARPFLFSTSMTIPDVAACIKGIEMLGKSKAKVKTLWDNTEYFKDKMQKLGFDLGKSQTPIIPVMLGDVDLTKEFSKKLFEKGIFASAIVYPMVAKDASRIRVMISAGHTKKHLDEALTAFAEIGKELKVI